jgi:hypothetical protein
MAQTSERLQNNDLALTGGGQFAFSNPLDLGAAWALEGAFAHALMSVPLASLSAELPVAGSFTSSLPTLNGFHVARSYNALFITPGVRLRLAPSFPLSPYLSAGSGMRVSIGSTSMGLPAPAVRWRSISVAGSI